MEHRSSGRVVGPASGGAGSFSGHCHAWTVVLVATRGEYKSLRSLLQDHRGSRSSRRGSGA
jgi:hypothetical protein